MGIEIRQLVVKSTVTREAERPAEEQARAADLRALREQVLEESRRLVVHARAAEKER